MNLYQDIYLLPNSDINLYFIWQKLYKKVHLALVENKIERNASKIGVSFPEYNADEFLLGTKLRLFATNERALRDMQCEEWLTRLHDYVHVKPIAPIPEVLKGHACFMHIKIKGNKEKLARRRAKRKGENFQEALLYYKNYKEQQNKLPYINMASQTNGHRFRLFIEKQLKEQPQTGVYSCYGLSKTTTVPLF